ncbi:LacI family DNA-binding transcriptional regulator [Nocardiopsis ansamitocini]|nr:LacI family DNA-binding transcriptional regulator [Nocardiopsis ansamitocini]
MSDVARRAGVSASTVSRVLRGAPGVAPAVRARVERAAAELSYAVARDASSLVTGATGRVAAIVPFLHPWFFGVALSGLVRRLRTVGLDTLVYEAGTTGELAGFIGELPLRRNVDAVVALALSPDPESVRRLESLGLPVVFCSRTVPGRSSVCVDDRGAAADATRYLLNLGHVRIAYLQSRDDTGFSWSSQDRVSGYLDAMERAGTHPQVVTTGPGSGGGWRATAELLASDPVPTALFAESDDVAMGALGVLRRCRVPVPGAMSVIGFDNQDMAEVMDLTTVAQPVTELGEEAGRMVAALLAGEEAGRQVRLATRLVVRHSAAAPLDTTHRPTRTHQPIAKEPHEP